MCSGSYAYYQVTKTQTNVNLVQSGCFSIEFKEITDSINLTDAYPMTDKQGLTQTPYTFTLTNTCNIASNFTITLNTLDIADNIPDSNLKIAINRTTTTQATKYLTDLEINTDTEVLELINLKQSYIVESGVLNSGESITYDAYIWVDESADNSVQGKNMEAAVVIINAASVEHEGEYLADSIINKFEGKSSISTATDNLFTTISTSTEATMVCNGR